MTRFAALNGVLRAVILGLMAFAVFGPIVNLAFWAVAERWYWPHTLPQQYGFEFWGRVFSARGLLQRSVDRGEGGGGNPDG